MAPPSSDEARFARQIRFAPLGAAGQAQLERARVLLVGCGATGGILAQSLVRAGVGRLVLVDRDVVERSNLPRQVLFEEIHARESMPKSLAAADALARIGGPTQVEPRCAHVDAHNLDEHAQGVDLVLDGTDNLPTRYLINDWCVEHGVPWIYCGVVGASGLCLAVRPGAGACLRCVFPEPPPPGTLDTCDTAGVILPAVGAIGSLCAGFALRILAGQGDALEPALFEIDAWNGAVRRLCAPRDPACPCCALRSFPFLHAPGEAEPVVLCGRNAVQVPARAGRLDLEALARRLVGLAQDVRATGPLLRFRLDGFQVSVFRDGRALVEGTADAARARALVDRVVSV
jgi:adenylyltransferase/sulfurtransferase